MKGDTQPTRADWRKARGCWWDTPGIDPEKNERGDAEVQALDRLARSLWPLPDWALTIRAEMPRWGREMCAHRWLDGLDILMRQVASSMSWPFQAGHCGDVPGVIYQQAETLAAAVQGWLDGDEHVEIPRDDVAAWLGKGTPDKRVAATCFVLLVRARFGQETVGDELKSLAGHWIQGAAHSPVLAHILVEQNLREHLDNACGFAIIRQLEDFIKLIGGDTSVSPWLKRGVCNQQLHTVLETDPLRLETTAGYLWGWYAALAGENEQVISLSQECPALLGAAAYARHAVEAAVDHGKVGRWLVGSLFKTTKIWQIRALTIRGLPVPPILQVFPVLTDVL